MMAMGGNEEVKEQVVCEGDAWWCMGADRGTGWRVQGRPDKQMTSEWKQRQHETDTHLLYSSISAVSTWTSGGARAGAAPNSRKACWRSTRTSAPIEW